MNGIKRSKQRPYAPGPNFKIKKPRKGEKEFLGEKMPPGEDDESMLRHEKRLLELAEDQQRSNPVIVAHLMRLTFGVRRRMLIGKVGVDGRIEYNSVADVVNRFPFVLHEQYVNV